MQTISLATTRRQTTRLGFGCSGIVGGLERRSSLRLLETAFDAGVRHFDVAPMYGHGTAEEVLGEFLDRHTAEVTVTTKFGVLPEHQNAAVRFARSAVKQLLQGMAVPARSVRRTSAPVQTELKKAKFTPQEAARSLQQSRKRLRTESIDLFLLHEAEATELQDDGLLDFLHQQVAHGVIGAFGVGSTASSLAALQQTRSGYCPVVQSEWAAGDLPLLDRSRFYITHRALHGQWQQLYAALLAAPDCLSAWSAHVGADLQDQALWPRLLLRAALAANPQTIVLFSTTRTVRIRQNVVAAFDASLTAPALQLHNLLRSHAAGSNTSHLRADGRFTPTLPYKADATASICVESSYTQVPSS